MKITSSKEVYNCGLFRVTEDQAVDKKTGFVIKRSVVRHAGSAVIMAVDEKKRVLLVRQYRLPAEQYLWELPAGRIDPGEKPLQAAKRELHEETGYAARQWHHLTTIHPLIAYSDEIIEIFVARDLVGGERKLDPGEFLEVMEVEPAQALQWVREGRISDVKTVISLFWLDKINRGEWN
jgi:ADP-ribose pyrophosphatase